MVQRDDDEAWRSIVDNYGDRAEVDARAAGLRRGRRPLGRTSDRRPEPAARWDDPFPDSDWSEDRFVPPPPPPLPHPPRDRLMAWLGVFGSPTVLLVCLVLGIDLPRAARLRARDGVRRRVPLPGLADAPRTPRPRRRRSRRLTRLAVGARGGPRRRRRPGGRAVAGTSGGSRRWQAAYVERISAARAGSSSRSPTAETPPPTTTSAGSKAATRPATPTPEPLADLRERRAATGSPAWAAAVTAGPSTQVRALRRGEPGQHVAAAVLLPAARSGRTRRAARRSAPACARTRPPCHRPREAPGRRARPPRRCRCRS